MWRFLLLVFAYSAFGKDDFKGDQVLSVIPSSEEQLEFLSKWIESDKGIDVWKGPSVIAQNVDVHIDSSEVANVTDMLKENDIDFNVLISDLDAAFDRVDAENEQDTFYSGFDYSKYNRYSEIKMELGNLARSFPKKASKFTVGKSYEGDKLIGLKVTNGDSAVKPVIWIDGGIHAREWISPATVMFFIHLLLTSDRLDVQQVLNKYDFYFLPVFNVDGYKYTWTNRKARTWRKTRSHVRVGCVGADPNRNWDYKFGEVGTSVDPCSDIYHGPYAFSEIEVKQVADYLKSIPNLKSYWNVHAYSQLVLTPWCYKTELPDDYPEMERVANVFVDHVSRRYGTEYKAGPPSRILYPVAGGSIDWTYAVLGVKYSYALELRDQGKYGFVLPPSFIVPSGLETSDALLAAILEMK